MSAPTLITLPPAAFASLLHAVHSAIKRHPPHCAGFQPNSCGGSGRCCALQPSTESDAVECGFALGDAKLEIDRLRRLLLGIHHAQITQRNARPTPDEARPSLEARRLADLASPMQRRRSYAVPALGDVPMPPMHRASSGDSHQAVRVTMITNLGTRLDALI